LLAAVDSVDPDDAPPVPRAQIIDYSAPADGPFGRTFTFADPDGYQATLHDRG